MARNLENYTKPQQEAIKEHRRARGKARRAKMKLESVELAFTKGDASQVAVSKAKKDFATAQKAADTAKLKARRATRADKSTPAPTVKKTTTAKSTPKSKTADKPAAEPVAPVEQPVAS